MRTLFALCFIALAACQPVAAPDQTGPDFNGTPPQGFGETELVTMEAMVLPVIGPSGAPTQDIVVAAGDYPVRHVAADRVRVGFTGAILADGSVGPAPVVYETAPTLRVAAASKMVAVIVMTRYCGYPIPSPEDLYTWGDEPVMRADDTGEYQFQFSC